VIGVACGPSASLVRADSARSFLCCIEACIRLVDCKNPSWCSSGSWQATVSLLGLWYLFGMSIVLHEPGHCADALWGRSLGRVGDLHSTHYKSQHQGNTSNKTTQHAQCCGASLDGCSNCNRWWTGWTLFVQAQCAALTPLGKLRCALASLWSASHCTVSQPQRCAVRHSSKQSLAATAPHPGTLCKDALQATRGQAVLYAHICRVPKSMLQHTLCSSRVNVFALCVHACALAHTHTHAHAYKPVHLVRTCQDCSIEAGTRPRSQSWVQRSMRLSTVPAKWGGTMRRTVRKWTGKGRNGWATRICLWVLCWPTRKAAEAFSKRGWNWVRARRCGLFKTWWYVWLSGLFKTCWYVWLSGLELRVFALRWCV